MQIKDLDGNFQKWALTGCIAHGTMRNKSDLHLRARKLIKECFPTFQILEEVPIPLRRSETLFMDFYLPLTKKCIEIHGEQHYKFVPFYHKNLMGFAKHKKRDQEKHEWCSINDIEYIALPFNENIEQWTKRLINE